MFESLEMAPSDAILGLTEAFHQDPHPHKINLTVGVYQDPQGRTPILRCVKEVEQRLIAGEQHKGYLGIDGLPQFRQRAAELLFGPDHPILAQRRAVTLQTPGGTAALRVAAELIHQVCPQASIWCSKPTWVNHPAIFESAGLTVKPYAYLDSAGTGLDFAASIRSLKEVPPGDAVCLHACCHNPTGIDPSPDEWSQIAAVIRDRRLLPLVDFAYHGFGDGLTEDAVGLMALCQLNRELLVCTSYSKNFGLYGERVGALTIVADTPSAAEAALSHAKRCVRANYSNPPKHGALIVGTILGDEPLRRQWEQELAEMRGRIHAMRYLFVQTMKDKAPDHDFSFLVQQRGMFSYSGLTPLQVDELRNQHGIYIVGSGRINVAGMTQANMERLCEAIASVL